MFLIKDIKSLLNDTNKSVKDKKKKLLKFLKNQMKYIYKKTVEKQMKDEL